NFVGGVWFGNDDYTSTNRMTGGSLPAMTWHTIMEYAHQGIELRQLPGVAVPAHVQQVAARSSKSDNKAAAPRRPTLLSKRGAEALVHVERLLDDANRSMTPLRPAVSNDRKRQIGLSDATAVPETGDALAAALEGHAFGSSN
ncbi:MAG: penicillin-binding protein, partial [Pseudolabrys sp.]